MIVIKTFLAGCILLVRRSASNAITRRSASYLKTLLRGGILLFSTLAFAQNMEFRIDMVTHINTASEFWINDNTIYAATTGGLLIQNLESGETRILTAADGLFSHHLTAMAQNRDSLLILGSLTGNLAFLNLQTETVSNDQNLRGNEIVDLTAIEDTLWVLSKDFVSVYMFNRSQGRYQFRESYQEFGVLIEQFYAIEHANNRIWLASNAGLIHASANFLKVNLYASSNWTQFTTANGLPGNDVRDIAKDPDRSGELYLATNGGIAKYNFSNFETISPVSLLYLTVFENQVYGANFSDVYRISNGQTENIHKVIYGNISDIAVGAGGQVWASIQKRGIRNLSTGQDILIDGPLDNYLGEMLIDQSGRLWCTSGIAKDERRQGIFVRTAEGWVNFLFAGGTNAGFSRLNSSMAVFEDAGENIWVGAWGGGLVIFDKNLNFTPITTVPDTGIVWISSVTRDDTLEVTTPPELQTVLSPVTVNPYYSVVTDIIADRESEFIWIINSAAGNNREILQYNGAAFGAEALSPATWESYDLDFNGKEWFEISQDVFADFWLITGVPSLGVGVGQIRFQETGFETRGFSENDNLKTNSTFSVAADDDGYIWVGTRSGLNAILNGAVFDFRETYQPIGLQINDIFVDSRNNKWFATDKGLSVLQATGSPFDPQSWVDLVPHNTSIDPEQLSLRANLFQGNLPSEKIHNIYIDERTGEIYLATDAGLAILHNNPFASTFADFEQLKVGPNPFFIGDGETGALNFYNIVAGSEVKILTPNGQLIRHLKPENSNEIRGGIAQWDGRNMEGKLVATGVYVFLAANENGEAKAGKVLVVRR
jgi:ligand-binding sensor domain-containing protein